MSHRVTAPPLVRTRDFGHEVQLWPSALVHGTGSGLHGEELFLDSAKQSVTEDSPQVQGGSGPHRSAFPGLLLPFS